MGPPILTPGRPFSPNLLSSPNSSSLKETKKKKPILLYIIKIFFDSQIKISSNFKRIYLKFYLPHLSRSIFTLISEQWNKKIHEKIINFGKGKTRKLCPSHIELQQERIWLKLEKILFMAIS